MPETLLDQVRDLEAREIPFEILVSNLKMVGIRPLELTEGDIDYPFPPSKTQENDCPSVNESISGVVFRKCPITLCPLNHNCL